MQMSDRLRFAHRLTADAAYGALLAINRRLLHSLAADVLEARHVPGTPGDVELLAAVTEHLYCAERLAEAFQRMCSVLLLKVETGRVAGWDELAQRAQELWLQLRAADPGRPFEATEYLRARATLHRYQGRLDESEMDYAAMLDQARAAGDSKLEATALFGLGSVMQSRGRMADVLGLMEPALEVARTAGDTVRCGLVLNSMAIALHSLGKDDEALACLDEALQLAAANDDRRRVGTVSGNLGVIHFNLGNSALALEYYTTELTVARELGDIRAESFALSHLGSVYRKEGRLAESRACNLRDLELCRMMGDRANIGFAYGSLANLAEDEGDYTAALELLEQAIAETRAGGDIRFTAQWLFHRGAVLIRLGRLEEAEGALSEAFTLATTAQDHWILGSVHCRRAQLALARASAACAPERRIWLEQARREVETAQADARDYGASTDSDMARDIARITVELEALERT